MFTAFLSSSFPTSFLCATASTTEVRERQETKRRERREKLSRRRCLQDDVFSTQASQLSEPTSVNPTITCPPRNALCEHGIFKSLFSLFRPFYNTSAGRFFEYLKEPPVLVPRNTSDSKNRRLGWLETRLRTGFFHERTGVSRFFDFPFCRRNHWLYTKSRFFEFFENQWVCRYVPVMITGGYIWYRGQLQHMYVWRTIHLS